MKLGPRPPPATVGHRRARFVSTPSAGDSILMSPSGSILSFPTSASQGIEGDRRVQALTNPQPLRSHPCLVPCIDHLLLNLSRCLVWLPLGHPRSVPKSTRGLLPEDIVRHRPVNAKHSGRIGDVATIRLQVLRDRQPSCFWVNLP